MLGPAAGSTLERVPAIIAPGAIPSNPLTWSSGRPSSLPKNSVPLALYGSGSLNLIGGKLVSYSLIYRTQPWVFIAANGIGRQIARLPWKTFELLDGGNKTRSRESGLANLMRKPDPASGRSPVALGWEIALSLLVHGNAAERLWRPGAGRPPDRMTRLDWRFLIPYVYGGAVVLWQYCPPDGPVEYLGPEEVVHFTWAAPDGPIGVSPLEALGVTIRSEDAAQRYSEANFKNGARMGVGIVLNKDVTADEAIRNGLREEVKGNHGGLDNAFNPVILGGGVEDIKPLGGQSAVEAALIEQRKVNREEVAAAYQAPPPLVGILENATLANVGEFHKMLYRTVLGPWLSMMSATVVSQIVERVPQWEADGLFVEHELGEVLKGDPRERMAAYQIAIGAGVLTLNDVRRLENLTPYDSPLADEPLVMANDVRPLSAIMANPDAAVPDTLSKALRDTLEEMIGAEFDSRAAAAA